eukprot:SAG31_NODE_13034_length_898_cov_0.625782_2_plen_146_part_01
MEQFVEWCSSSGHSRLNITGWLRLLGESWLHTMAIPEAKRELGGISQPAKPISRDIKADYSYNERIREAVDKCFAKYAVNGYLCKRPFLRCMRRLGLTNSCFADRLFRLHDRKLRQFLDPEDFQEIFRLLIESTEYENEKNKQNKT